MRILTLTNIYPNPLHPHRAPYNKQQMRALAQKHAVRVIAPLAWTEERVLRRRTGQRLPADRRAVCDGIPVEHPRYLFPPKILRGWHGHCFRRSVRPAFERAVTEFRPDLVFAPWAYPDGWAAVQLGHRAKLPVILKVHGSDILQLPTVSGAIHRRVCEAVTQAEGVVAVSQDLANHVIDLGADPDKVQVVYDGIDPGVFHAGSRQEARARLGLDRDMPLVLFVGNLIPLKGTEDLLEACAQLARSGVSFACRLIGEGPLFAPLEQQIRRLQLEPQVRLLGPMPHAQLADWFRAASVFVLPSYSEGVPCVLLEAAACATPFVASRVGGIHEIAHLAPSRLVPPGDAKILAEAIREQIHRPQPDTPQPHAEASRDHAQAAVELAAFFTQTLQLFRSSQPREGQWPAPLAHQS